jgi:acyl-CoA synthetase (AMP-forming)/AMP-acid ligase II
MDDTISDLLWRRAQQCSEVPAFLQLGRDEVEERAVTFGDLHASACGLAETLGTEGASGSRVLVAQSTSLDFLVSYFGCLYAGAVPVPA